MHEGDRIVAGRDEGDELERLRRAYEDSLSWRLTRPIRVAGRLARAVLLRKSANGSSKPAAKPTSREEAKRGQEPSVVDSWLEQFYGARLAAIEAACAQAPSAALYALFRDLDDDAWAILLTQQYQLYPHIRALLPGMPERALQEAWNGASGLALARQSRSFYAKLRASYQRHGSRPLAEASVLDFGCGWGRLTRYLLRDVAPGRLYGCDPAEEILGVCRAHRVPAVFAASAFVPDRLPFDERFHLAFAFSVFTHLSEVAHEKCLLALHQSLRPGGILIITIRPLDWLSRSPPLRPLMDALGPDSRAGLAGPRYLFVPHFTDRPHPQASADGQIHYGEAVITMAYVRERWSKWFELLDSEIQLEDLHQVVLTLRRR
jgi:SAM-dependent methyltransferase